MVLATAALLPANELRSHRATALEDVEPSTNVKAMAISDRP